MFACPRCDGTFTLRTAYCEDWSDETRNFGCPHCRTFYRRVRRPRTWQEHLAQAHYIAAFVIGLPLLIAKPYAGLHWLLVPAWIVFAVWLAFRLDRARGAGTMLVPTHAYAVSSDDD